MKGKYLHQSLNRAFMEWDYVRNKSQNEERVTLNEGKMCGGWEVMKWQIYAQKICEGKIHAKNTVRGNLERKNPTMKDGIYVQRAQRKIKYIRKTIMKRMSMQNKIVVMKGQYLQKR